MSATSTKFLDWIGTLVARRLIRPTSGYEPYAAARPELVAMTIRPADVLLVEGARSKINSAIRYLTQSTWSHAAFYVGLGAKLGEARWRAPGADRGGAGQGRDRLAAIEVRDLQHPHLPPGRPDARRTASKVVRYVVERIGYDYDLKNIIDLMRYFLPQPPVPASWRRRMIALGSGEPTRAICSSLIAQAFESVGYPILPDVAPGGRPEPPRDPAHPPPFALRAARFRRVAVLCYRQADHRDRIRLQADEMGEE